MTIMKNSKKTTKVEAKKNPETLSPKEWNKITQELISLTVKYEELKTKVASKG